jgi:hypothetical protein
MSSDVYGMCFLDTTGCFDLGYVNSSRYTTNLTFLPILATGTGSGYYTTAMTSVYASLFCNFFFISIYNTNSMVAYPG